MNKQKLIMFPKSVTLLSVKVSGTSKREVLKIIENSLRKNVQIFITTPNPEIVLQAQGDKKLQEAINKSDIALPDGIGILWASKRLKLPLKLNRIAGREMMEEIISLANHKNYKLFLLGASESSNKKALAKVVKKYPKLRAEGTSDIKVDNKGKASSDKALKMINDFKPHILFVALGAPKQEKWVADNLSKLNVGVAMVVGGALDYYAGSVARVPAVVSRVGLEWLWRLVTQPTRLPRIFNAVVKFPLLVLRTKM